MAKHPNFTPLEPITPPVSGFVPAKPFEGGFIEKAIEATARGRQHVLANIAVHKAVMEGGDILGAHDARVRLLQEQALNPLESNLLSDIVYSSATTGGQMWEVIKKGGKGAVIGGGIGAGVGLGASLLAGGPTGEEFAAVGTGAKVGAEIGGGVAATSFSFREGFGAMYSDMLLDGVEPEIARQFAEYGAIPYSLIEVLQLRTAAPAVKAGIQAIVNKAQQKLLKKALKTYGSRLSREVIQEIGQEVVQITAGDVARHLSKHDIQIDADYIKSRLLRLGAVTKESAKAFALIPAPGVGIEAVLQYQANVAATEAVANKAELDGAEVERYVGEIPEIGEPVYEVGNAVVWGKEAALMLEGLLDVQETTYTEEGAEESELKPTLELSRQENETPNEWSLRVFDKPLQEETSIGLKPTDVTHPTSQFQIALDNALAESAHQYELQKEIRKTEKKGRFTEMEVAARKAAKGNWRAAAKAALKGEYVKLEINPLQNVIPYESFVEMDGELRTTNAISRIEAVKLGDALEALYKEGKILRPHEIEYARKVWGDRFASTLQALLDASKGKYIDISDYLAIPKAVMASGDISRTLRQNIMMMRRPKLWAKALTRDIETFAKDKTYARMIENTALRDNAEIIHKSGIRINKWGEAATVGTAAERFPSKFARKVPFIARSERAYVVGGNLLRVNFMRDIANQRAGILTTDKQWKDLGHVVNILTGEGDARRLLGMGPTLNAIFFAPRLFESRIRAFTDLFNPKLSWAARRILAEHVGTFVGTNIGLLMALGMVPGVNVEWDKRSSDWLKVKLGNTRIDFWGGYLPIARLFVRLAQGEIKTQAGRIIPADARETISTFLQGKLGPIPAYGLDLIKGETFIGDNVSLEADSLVEQFYQRFTPLFFQDLVDAARYGGWDKGAIGGTAAFLGASVVSYPMSKNTEVVHKKNMLSMQAVGEKWDNLGSEVQELLRHFYPEIDMMERQADFDRQDWDFLAKLAEQRDKSVKKMYDALPQDVQFELDSLAVRPSGVSSRIGTDWFLNEDRRKEYEETTTKLYKRILPKLIRSPRWNTIPPQYKVVILSKVMNEIKEVVRAKIIAGAQVEDIQRIQRNIGRLKEIAGGE
jgi:hypothetical protein